MCRALPQPGRTRSCLEPLAGERLELGVAGRAWLTGKATALCGPVSVALCVHRRLHIQQELSLGSGKRVWESERQGLQSGCVSY